MTAFGDGDAALIGTDALLPAATIARICCDADLSIAQVNAWGDPFNLYRGARNASITQRRALVIRDRGCVFPGCDRPPAHCQAHHIKYWSADGYTNMDNLALVCWFHHRLLHEGGWHLQRIPPTQPDTPPGWLATGPDGRQLREHRQPTA
ncbi:MAG: hypothetical protein QOF82_2934 [Frankiales bacterium]|nr:hypothetical protein [Frankiales bacterium]